MSSRRKKKPDQDDRYHDSDSDSGRDRDRDRDRDDDSDDEYERRNRRRNRKTREKEGRERDRDRGASNNNGSDNSREPSRSSQKNKKEKDSKDKDPLAFLKRGKDNEGENGQDGEEEEIDILLRDWHDPDEEWHWFGGYNEEFRRDLDPELKAKWDKKIQIPDQNVNDVNTVLAFRHSLLKNKDLVRSGIPAPYRFHVWELLSGAATLPDRLEHVRTYQFFLGQAKKAPPKEMRDIKADLSRALLSHPKYTSKNGQNTLKRILAAFAMRTPQVGYCNSMSHIVGFLYLFYSEEQAFWMLCALIDIVLPPDYYSNGLVGSRADTHLIKILVFRRLSKLHAHLEKHGVDIVVIVLKWLMCIWTITMPLQSTMRLWDALFLEGPTMLLSVTMALLKLHEKILLSLDDAGELMEKLNSIGTEWWDVELLLKTVTKESACKITHDDLVQRNTEKRIMENAYMKDLQETQARRKADEERRAREAAELKAEEEAEEDSLSYGTEMWKLPIHSGKPRKTTISLIKDEKAWYITWKSKKKKQEESRLRLLDCLLYEGMNYGMFVRRPEWIKQFGFSKNLAFTFIHPTRSLDLVCTTSLDYELWLKVLRRIMPKPEVKFEDEEGDGL